MAKKERSDAQRAADKRYYDKKPNCVLMFTFKKHEGEELKKEIINTGLSKPEFLRRAVANKDKFIQIEEDYE